MTKLKITRKERNAHIKQYPLPDWCKEKNKQKNLIYSKEWKLLRRVIIDKYGAQCMKCGAVDNITIDHIKPKSQYPELALDINNLQVLCWGCNKEKGREFFDYRQSCQKQDVMV